MTSDLMIPSVADVDTVRLAVNLRHGNYTHTVDNDLYDVANYNGIVDAFGGTLTERQCRFLKACLVLQAMNDRMLDNDEGDDEFTDYFELNVEPAFERFLEQIQHERERGRVPESTGNTFSQRREKPSTGETGGGKGKDMKHKSHNLFTVKELKDGIKKYHYPREVLMGSLKKPDLEKLHHHLLRHGVTKAERKSKPTDELYGLGIMDLFRGIKKEYTNSAKKGIQKYGNLRIVAITVCRQPIMAILDKVINVISFGKWSRAKKEENFDKLFHLFMLVRFDNNSSCIVEKNEKININGNYKINDQTEQIAVPLNGQQLTLNNILETALKTVGQDQYFLYHPITNNCQNYILNLLKSSNLGDQDDYTFIKQDVTTLAKKIGKTTTTIMKGVTDLGAKFAEVTGRGMEDLPSELTINGVTYTKSEAEGAGFLDTVKNIYNKAKPFVETGIKIAQNKDVQNAVRNGVDYVKKKRSGGKRVYKQYDSMAQFKQENKEQHVRNDESDNRARAKIAKEKQDHEAFMKQKDVDRANRKRLVAYIGAMEEFLSQYGYPQHKGQTITEFLEFMKETEDVFIQDEGNWSHNFFWKQYHENVLEKLSPISAVISGLSTILSKVVGKDIDGNKYFETAIGFIPGQGKNTTDREQSLQELRERTQAEREEAGSGRKRRGGARDQLYGHTFDLKTVLNSIK